MVALGEVVAHRKEFIHIDDLQWYKRCRVQLHTRGIVLRDQISGLDIKTKIQQVCRSGELLVAEIDAKHGGYGIVPDELDGAIVSSHYFLFEIDQEKLERGFLGYYLKTPAFFEQVTAQGSTNYAAIRPGHLLDYRIPLPSLPEQQQIVEWIDAVATCVEEAKDLRDQVSMETSALAHSAGRNVLAQIQGDVRTIDDVCESIIDCLHSNPVNSDEGIPTLRSPDVEWGTLNLCRARRTDEAEYERRTRRGEPKAGDIIVVREGGGTGKAGITLPGQRFSLGQRVMMLRPDTTVIEPRFLLYYWLSPLIQEEQIRGNMKGSASPHLNIRATKRFPIVVPSKDTQRKVVNYFDEIHRQLSDVQSANVAATTLVDAILPSILIQVFNGRE